MRVKLFALSLLVLPSLAFAGSYTEQSIGNINYVNGSNGYSGSGQQIGNVNYYHDNQGNFYTTQSIGNIPRIDT